MRLTLMSVKELIIPVMVTASVLTALRSIAVNVIRDLKVSNLTLDNQNRNI